MIYFNENISLKKSINYYAFELLLDLSIKFDRWLILFDKCP